MRRTHWINRGIVMAFAAIGCLACLSCSSSRPEPQGSDIDPAALGYFLDGEYFEAVHAFNRLLDEAETDTEKREIYYYLGRSYLELGDTRAAIDAFSAGVALGDRGPCLEYLDMIRSEIEGTPRSVALRPEVSRLQLAALVQRWWAYGDTTSMTAKGALEPGPPLDDAAVHGWLPWLADGNLHGEAVVTRASFYVFAARLCADIDCAEPVPLVLGSYPRSDEPIPGPEIVAALERLIPWKFPDGG